MSQKIATINSSEWDGTQEKSESFIARNIDASVLSGVRVIYDNQLDVDIDIGVELTDDQDENNDRATTADFDGSSTKTVTSSDFDDDLLTEPYSKVIVKATPNSTPSDGAFNLYIDG